MSEVSGMGVYERCAARLRRFYWQRLRRHRYEMCSCGRPVAVVWTADDALFERVNGSPYGCLCIPCFDGMCEVRGLYLRWVPQPLDAPFVHTPTTGGQ